jgi:tape measure domain-containing protein
MANNLEYTLRLKDLFSKSMKSALVETKNMDNQMSSLKSTIQSLTVGLGGAFLAKDVVMTTAKFQSLENAIKATGDAKNIQFLNEQGDRLGLDITAAYQGYKTFSGALMGTVLAGEQGNKVFRQVSEAATVMGLSGEQTEGAFLALGQMMSKGTVSAEELRGQLGERIPGAFQIAAKAMNVTTEELGKMMQKGQIVAGDFLPKFGNELEKRFGKQAGAASNSLQANLNKLNTSWERLKVSMGNSLMPVITLVTKGLTSLANAAKALLPLIKIGITLWASYYIKLKIATVQSYHFAVAQRAMAMGMSASGVAATWVSRGIRGIGAAIKSVPIIGWIMALVEGVSYLWDTFSGFRESVYAFIESIKVMGQVLGLQFKGVWNVITGNREEGLKQIAEASAIQLGAAFKGIKKGQASFKKDNQGISGNLAGIGGSLSGGAGGAGGDSKSLSTGSEVSGKRPQSLTINIDKLIEQFNLSTTNIQEGTTRVKEMVAKALLESVNDINLMATS